MNETAYPIITISREFGSGGHSIGLKVSEILGIPFYDKNIVEKAAEESGFSQDFITEKGEYIDRWAGFALNRFNAPYATPQDTIYLVQRQIILDAAKSPCVIVGRCADCILSKAGVKLLKVFIHADDQCRAERVERRYGKTEIAISKRLHDKDKQRKAYYRYYTETEWGDCRNYHLNLDSGVLGEEQCVSIIVNAARSYHVQQIGK